MRGSSPVVAAAIDKHCRPRTVPIQAATRNPGNPLFAGARLLRAEHQATEAAAVLALARTPAGLWASGQPNEMQQVRQVIRSNAVDLFTPGGFRFEVTI